MLPMQEEIVDPPLFHPASHSLYINYTIEWLHRG
jgi:hypothetical protein